MSKRLFATTLAFLVTGSLAFAQAPAKPETKAEAKTETKTDAKAEKAPRLTIVEPVKDYGTVPKGDKLDWAFVVKNTGDADLQIISAKPGCGCTVADFDKVVKPGETGKVTAHVDTTAFAGPIAKTVTLETNDPSTPTAQLTLHAIVKPYVEAYPAGFVRFNMLQGDTDSQSVTLYSEEDEPFQIVKVESPVDWIKVDYKKIDDTTQLAQGVGRRVRPSTSSTSPSAARMRRSARSPRRSTSSPTPSTSRSTASAFRASSVRPTVSSRRMA
jgi:hypothetical protein